MNFFDFDNEQLVVLAEVLARKLSKGLGRSQLAYLASFFNLVANNLTRYSAIIWVKETKDENKC